MFYATTIFLSSFLLFLVQPLIARLILPWFGGTAAVWTTCMLFFQCVLLAGYAYAHGTTARLKPRQQALLHTVLLIAALLVLPIAPDASWKPQGDSEPISRILLLLTATVGLPYLLISSTSPLVQAWFARVRPGANPYRLFAVSNFASLLALIGYPLLVEPNFTNGQQVAIWSWMFAGFAALCAALAWLSARVEMSPLTTHADVSQSTATTAVPGWGRIAVWLTLSATGSVLLLAITNHLTQNVAAIPLLWLAPLTLYLLTFILCFEGQGLYRPQWAWAIVVLALGAMLWLVVDTRYQFELYLQLAVYLVGLFVACMFCHGELYRLRPDNRHLTAFYLWVSVGGAVGGLLVAVVAPLVFNAYHELALGLLAACALAVGMYWRLHWIARLFARALLICAVGGFAYDAFKFRDGASLTTRNFYGVLRVKSYGAPGEPEYSRRLLHGVIMHGEQYLTGDASRRLTTYYQRDSGIGKAIESRGKDPVHVGVIGLGVGTLAGYGRAGDTYRIYEINPAVLQIARTQFKYLTESPAKVDVVLGDARLNLEREPSQQFDVLAIDAFSSDSIPVHLITREALGVYLRHLKPNGIVAFHVSNRFLELAPVVAQIAAEHGAVARVVEQSAKDEDDTTSDWVLVSRDPSALQGPVLKDIAQEVKLRTQWRVWTDDYSNLIQILK